MSYTVTNVTPIAIVFGQHRVEARSTVNILDDAFTGSDVDSLNVCVNNGFCTATYTAEPGKTINPAAAAVAPVAATKTVAGVVKQCAKIANAAGSTPTQAEYDGLLAALVTAGLMAAS